jgi:hypothetical protein
MNCRTQARIILLLLSVALISTEPTQAKAITTRERLIAEVVRLGGSVEFDETLTRRPIVKIDLHGTQIKDDDLVFLERGKSELNELRYLDLRLTKIGDAGVAKLKNLKSLETLNLFRTQLGNDGLAHLKKLTELRTLLIGGTRVTDSGLAALRPFRKLRKLSLFQTQVSDDGIAQLKQIPSLEVLLITGSKISPAGTQELRKALPKVRFSEDT